MSMLNPAKQQSQLAKLDCVCPHALRLTLPAAQQINEQACAIAGCALRWNVRVIIACCRHTVYAGHASDIQVRPGRAVNKVAQKRRRCGRTTIAPAAVLDVCRL